MKEVRVIENGDDRFFLVDGSAWNRAGRRMPWTWPGVLRFMPYAQVVWNRKVEGSAVSGLRKRFAAGELPA